MFKIKKKEKRQDLEFIANEESNHLIDKSVKDIVEKQETRIGLNVKVMFQTKFGWRWCSGLVSLVDGGRVDVWVFPSCGSNPKLLTEVRHANYAVKGQPCWDYVRFTRGVVGVDNCND